MVAYCRRRYVNIITTLAQHLAFVVNLSLFVSVIFFHSSYYALLSDVGMLRKEEHSSARSHLRNISVLSCTCGRTYSPANTKKMYNIYTMLDQRRRRWVDVSKMLYTYFVFTGELTLRACKLCQQVLFQVCKLVTYFFRKHGVSCKYFLTN